MFSKGKKKGGGPATASSETLSSGLSMLSEPGEGTARRQPSGVPSIISADLTIEGNLVSHGDLQVDGTVKGDIRSRTLTLGEMGQVQGAIDAETVRICGEVDGEVRAATVMVTKTAKVRGDIVHDSLAIEAGAFIDGHCRRDVTGATAVSSPDSKGPDNRAPDSRPTATTATTGTTANGKVGGEPQVGGETKPAF